MYSSRGSSPRTIMASRKKPGRMFSIGLADFFFSEFDPLTALLLEGTKRVKSLPSLARSNMRVPSTGTRP